MLKENQIEYKLTSKRKRTRKVKGNYEETFLMVYLVSYFLFCFTSTVVIMKKLYLTKINLMNLFRIQ